jgi:hypothetical protein
MYRGHLFTPLLLALAGCTAIPPSAVPERPRLEAPQTFSHADFNQVLQHFVDDQGRVDYAALKADSRDLERYYLQLTTYSPDSHPAFFPTDQSKLAYWINAYNAAVLKTVLRYYPIASVEAIKPPFLLFFLPRKSGFFLFQRVIFGGKTTSLYFLEHGVVRKRFADPRVHFALNCASRSCPRLPQSAFTAEELHEQLDYEARRFVAEKRNVNIDHHQSTVWLSSIFDWYADDFLQWYRHHFPGEPATLLRYIALYASPEHAEELKQATSYTVRFVAYDWGLNDQDGQA